MPGTDVVWRHSPVCFFITFLSADLVTPRSAKGLIWAVPSKKLWDTGQLWLATLRPSSSAAMLSALSGSALKFEVAQTTYYSI